MNKYSTLLVTAALLLTLSPTVYAGSITSSDPNPSPAAQQDSESILRETVPASQSVSVGSDSSGNSSIAALFKKITTVLHQLSSQVVALSSHKSLPAAAALATAASSTATTTIVSLQGYQGVDPKGLKDSTDGIMAAIGTGNVRVDIPCGTYLISRTIMLPSYTELNGSSTGCVILRASSTLAINPLWKQYIPNSSVHNLLSNAKFDFGNTNIYVHGLTLDGSSIPGAHLASFMKSHDINVEFVRFLGGPNGPAGDGVSFIGSDHYLVKGCVCSNMSNACYDQWDGVHDFTIANNTVDGGGTLEYGVLVNGISGGNAQYSYKANTSYNGNVVGNKITNTKALGIGVFGLCDSASSTNCGTVHDISILQNSIDTVSDPATGLSYYGILVDGTTMNIAGNTIQNTYQSGIYVGRPKMVTSSVTVRSNTISDTNMGYASTTKPTKADAIDVTNAADAVTVTNNIVSGTHHRYGVRIDPGVTNAVVCLGATASGTIGVISDLGTGTTFPCLTTIGYIQRVSGGIAQGWAFDKAASSTNITVNFYLNATKENGGSLIGSAPANEPFALVNSTYGITGDHGFSFSIPANLRDGKPYTLFVQPVDINGIVGKNITPDGGLPFSLFATSSAAAGYDIIVVAGQSNSVGAGMGTFSDPYESTTNDARIMQFGRIDAANGAVIPATWTQGGVTYDALQHWAVPKNRQTMGFAIPFARRYIAAGKLASGREVLIVPAGYGGTSILKWLGEINTPTTTPVALYDDMRLRVKAALALPGNNKIVAFLWHQGESDVSYMTSGNPDMSSSTVYQKKFSTLIGKVRSDFPSSPAFPIIAGEFAPSWVPTNTFKLQTESVIGNVLANDVRGGLVSSAGLESDYPTYTSDASQIVHFSSSAQVSFGGRYYDKWAQLISNGVASSSVSIAAPANSNRI